MLSSTATAAAAALANRLSPAGGRRVFVAAARTSQSATPATRTFHLILLRGLNTGGDTNTESSSSSGLSKRRMAECFQVLELDPGSSRDLVRRQYVRLVKKFHPDSPTGNVSKFQKVDEAYNTIMDKFRADQRDDDDCVGEFGLYYQARKPKDGEDEDEEYEHPDIRHTAPQHRQYLSHEGLGFGTPGQRMRQYESYRAFRASESVLRHKIDKLTSEGSTLPAVDRSGHSCVDSCVGQDGRRRDDVRRSRRHRTRGAVERLVEDLISESMAKGEFENLKGKGKPLPDRLKYNPFSDFTSHKINEILAEGGFAPEWIMMKKDIRDECSRIRDLLTKKRIELGPAPLSKEDQARWQVVKARLEEDVKRLNQEVDRFNLVVPMMNEQMFHFGLDREAQRAMDMVVTQEMVDKLRGPGRTSPHQQQVKEALQAEIRFLPALLEAARAVRAMLGAEGRKEVVGSLRAALPDAGSLVDSIKLIFVRKKSSNKKQKSDKETENKS